MATSRMSGRPVRVAVFAAAAALAITLAPGSGYAEPAADPTTPADAQAQVVALNHDLEVVTEQYNDAQIQLADKQAEAASAQAELAQVQVQLKDLDSQVRVVAASAYMGEPISGFTAMMSSGSPQEFLDRLNTLDQISQHSNDVVAQLSAAQKRATELNGQASAALSAAATTAADLTSQKQFIEGEVTRVNGLLASLTETQRQAALDAQAVSVTTSTGTTAARSTTSSSKPVTSAPVAAPTHAAQIAVDTAYAQLGKPYVWGASGPNSFDCSGLTMYSYAAAGISLPHSSRAQSTMGVAVSRDALQPGDLVFFGSPVYHVAIYIGNGNMITAPQTGDVVKIQAISAMAYSGARRVATG